MLYASYSTKAGVIEWTSYIPSSLYRPTLTRDERYMKCFSADREYTINTVARGYVRDKHSSWRVTCEIHRRYQNWLIRPVTSPWAVHLNNSLYFYFNFAFGSKASCRVDVPLFHRNDRKQSFVSSCVTFVSSHTRRGIKTLENYQLNMNNFLYVFWVFPHLV